MNWKIEDFKLELDEDNDLNIEHKEDGGYSWILDYKELQEDLIRYVSLQRSHLWSDNDPDESCSHAYVSTSRAKPRMLLGVQDLVRAMRGSEVIHRVLIYDGIC